MDISYLSDTASVRYVEDSLSALSEKPCHFQCGLLMACVQGQAVVSTGVQQYEMFPRSGLVFLNGSLIQPAGATPDFRVRMLLFPKEVLFKAVLPVDMECLDFLHHVPFFRHTAHEDHSGNWDRINLWLDMARLLFSGGRPARYGEQLELNYLQSLLMWFSNTLPQEKFSLPAGYSRKQMLCHRFMHLLHEHSAQEHQVAFYADRLCITPRYLDEVVRTYHKGKSPKQLINEQLTAEIKVLLNAPHLSVTEIAQHFKFQEPTHLSRFFKRMTGMSPQVYRERHLSATGGKE